ncbi:gliding motility-associated C-terminal domain-containing protein [Muricauda sp. SCSIO 64092]|uniref:T9SS type B sorting domain-containing protein n=1 Tax=Allomuricauda sp. SCSIO 64092 TaxID=2908842 RepID=UPI001FF41F56|nr:gliding motility-associated C-terminal domain-containing protein [Muricauda sp. SCSIO 64092]UOY08862.1 gliding motility-associated C-terminal domain-containing protein [Muricauda sp. SCSIO 64092]
MRPKMLNSILRTMCCAFAMQIASGQVLNKPVPADNPNLPGNSAWTAACASDDFNEYFVNFTWNPPVVGSTNEFILELSDANGNFGSPVELSRVSDKNTNFDFDFQFILPQDTQGDNYRFRVRSTAPELVSEVSDAFSMYYIGFNLPILISRDGNGTLPPGGQISLCNGESLTLRPHNIPSAGNYKYIWYRSGTRLSESSTSLTINQSGMYYVEIDYGPNCSGSANTLSNAIDIIISSPLGLSINPPALTTLCPDDTVTLEANVSGMGHTYTWYKDGTAISAPTVDAHTYVVDGGIVGFEGDYSVEISGTGICLEQSAPIAISNPGSFTVNRDNAARLVLLPGQNETLTISTNASNPDIQWFKDGAPVAGETSTTLSISAPGDYYATVTETGGSCGVSTKTSETTTAVFPNAFDITVDYNGSYANCANSSVVLEVSQINATENGNTFDVTAQLIDDFTYQWFKDGTAVGGSTGASLSLTSSAENGIYSLEANLGAFSETSNTLEVVLNSGASIAISSNGTQLCNGVTVTLSTTYDLTGTTFNWSRNGQNINASSTALTANEAGVYQLSVVKDGCPILSNEITLANFDESIITVDAEENIIFPEGESQTVTASGGTSYEWYGESNTLLSSTDSVTLEQEGNYLLIATIDNCQITRNFTVTFRDDFQIPNVITANGDGINDLWVIPNTYSRQPDVTVIIYNELGDELLNQTGYTNNWPPSSLGFRQKNQLFYYKIRRANQTLKQGTITVIR